MLPDGGNIAMVEGEIEKEGEELQAKGTKVLEVEDCEAIRSGGTRVATIPDGLGD